MKLIEGRSIRQIADRDAEAFSGYTGFEENLQASLALMIDEEQSTSSANVYDRTSDNLLDFADDYISNIGDDFYSRRNKQILALVEGGVIDQSVKDNFTTRTSIFGSETDFDAMAEYVNENLDIGTELATNEGYEILRDEELATKRKLRDDIQSRQTGMGVFGEFAGYGLGGMTDPVTAVSMAFAAPAVGLVNVSRAMYAFSTGARVAALEMGVQASIEPFIHGWKEELGVEYTWQNSAFNIVGTGILAGAIGTLGAAIAYRVPGVKVDKELGLNELMDRNKQLGMSERDAESMAIFEHEANNAPDPDMPAEEFISDLEVKQEKMQSEGAEQADEIPIFDADEASKPTIERPETKADDAQAAAEREILLKIEAKTAEAKTLIDEMFDSLPDEEFIFIDGVNVPIKKIADDINDDIKDIDQAIECMLHGV